MKVTAIHGRKYSDILAICRQNFVYRRVWKRYLVEKYHSGEILGEIAKNQRYFLIYWRYGDKSSIFHNILDG